MIVCSQEIQNKGECMTKQIEADTQAQVDSVDKEEELLHDLKKVLVDVEALMDSALESKDAKLNQIKDLIQENLSHVQSQLAQTEIVDKARTVARSTEEFIKKNPWESIGIAVGLGALLGYLSRRR